MICPDNTIRQAFKYVIRESPIPWLNIAETAGEEAKLNGFTRVGILGTKYLMTGPVYPDAVRKFGIICDIPDTNDHDRIDEIIFKEFVYGIFSETSRLYFNEVILKLKQRGCEAVVLGCTEIPLIVDPNDCPLPTLDSTRLLARASLRKFKEKFNHSLYLTNITPGLVWKNKLIPEGLLLNPNLLSCKYLLK